MSEIKEERNQKTKEGILQENSVFKENSIRIIKGSLLAIIVSAIFLVVFAILLTYTNISESTITPVVLAIVGISILMGSYLSTRKIAQNGILNGAIVGIVYMLLLYIVSSMVFLDFGIGLNSLMMMGCGIIAGVIGGIIGVNTKK